MSHKLQVGEMKAAYLTDKEIWGHFNFIFSAKSRNSTTYKFVLIKSLIENLYNVNEKLELNYDILFNSFSQIYWNLVVHHDLHQINMVGKKAEVQRILLDAQSKYQIPDTFVFDKLSDELQIFLVNKVKRKCKLNVMGAIYGDTAGTIYDFDNEREYIRFNSAFYSFMQRFQRVLRYMSNYHLALFLEKFNEQGDTTKLLLKVENVSKRSSLDPFYQVLSSFYDGTCFYCKKSIKKKDQAHVDHFIPWSFVQADQLWNLVIACSTCNLSKNDKLAMDFFLEALMDRNSSFLASPSLKNREDMKVYTSKKLQDLYEYSIDNGYTDIWKPRKKICHP
ncbi:HNH endonuclease [Bacillus sp. FJAT-29790]|uniref:HNH endonuclease n=1 Tax=Bacillus sp. FJAT-29790 TaxID=1895002 RepID=UPI001C247FD8|nr:HNH endonuclease signature motif containing protein [Bacillus sp. FJAT-29790]MBU8878267.1 HNH endonuclease [Bacillus sp. FJAT-29790]